MIRPRECEVILGAREWGENNGRIGREEACANAATAIDATPGGKTGGKRPFVAAIDKDIKKIAKVA
jgi:hypothetical protein